MMSISRRLRKLLAIKTKMLYLYLTIVPIPCEVTITPEFYIGTPLFPRERGVRSVTAWYKNPALPGNQGHFASGGRDIRMASVFPPVLRPKVVPLS